MRARFFAKMFSRARWFGGKEEEPNLRKSVVKIATRSLAEGGGEKEGGERASENAERKSVNCRKSAMYWWTTRNSDREKAKFIFRRRWHRLSRGRTKLTGDGIDDAGRRRLHSHREVNSTGRSRGKDIQRCYVSFTYVMKIGTYTHAQHVHTYAHTGGWRERKRGNGRQRHIHTHTHGHHAEHMLV